MSTPANALDITQAGLVKFDGVSNFTGVTTTLNSILVGAASNGITNIALTNGQILIGSTGAAPVAATISAGSGIVVTNGANSITISTIDAGFTWNDQTADLNPIVKENGYFADKAASRLVLTLPTTSAAGDTFAIAGFGSQGWQLNAGTAQVIHLGNQVTSSGGSLASTNQYDALEVVCSPTTTIFLIRHVVGNLTVA